MEEISAAEVEERLAKLTGAPDEWEKSGGAKFSTALFLAIGSLLGILASLGLIMAEKKHLQDPEAALLCDVNPLIGCGKWIGTRQNEIFFGISNSVLGLAAFSALFMLALVLLAHGRFGAPLWRLLSIGALGGFIWICWFIYESLFVAHSLCPFCVLVWFATIPILIILIGRSLQGGHWGTAGEKYGRTIVRNRFLFLGGAYFLLTFLGIFLLWDKISVLF